MELKNGMTVIAPYNGYGSVRKGQEFIVSNVQESNTFYKYSFTINKGKFYCLLNSCSHINFKNWIIKK